MAAVTVILCNTQLNLEHLKLQLYVSRINSYLIIYTYFYFHLYEMWLITQKNHTISDMGLVF